MSARILVVAEHDGQKLNASTAKCVSCASALPGAEITVLVLAACSKGSNSTKAADDAGTGDGATDPAELAARFDKKCVAGDLEACRNLGVMYAEGTGVSPDPRRATALLSTAKW